MIRGNVSEDEWREYRRLALALGVSTQQLTGDLIRARLHEDRVSREKATKRKQGRGR